MNKYDIWLSIALIVCSLVLYFLFQGNNNYAYVYYDKELILTVDLSVEKEYKVVGYNGELVLEVKDNKLRVKKEESNYHLCSKQGFTNRGSIVCLPNKIVIEFKNNELDTVTG